jgi:hypothetical protein
VQPKSGQCDQAARMQTTGAPDVEQDSVLFEEAFVNPFGHIRLLTLHANIVANHQCAEFSAVDQDDSGEYPLGILDGFRREPARDNEDAPVRLGAVQGSGEFLGLRPPDRVALRHSAWQKILALVKRVGSRISLEALRDRTRILASHVRMLHNCPSHVELGGGPCETATLVDVRRCWPDGDVSDRGGM